MEDALWCNEQKPAESEIQCPDVEAPEGQRQSLQEAETSPLTLSATRQFDRLRCIFLGFFAFPQLSLSIA